MREITAAIQSERDGQAKRILAAVEVSKEASDEWEVVLQKRIEELKRQLATETTAYEGIAEKYVKIMDDLSPSSCGVKGHCKVDLGKERRLSERRVVAHICTPYSGDCVKFHPGRVGNQRTWRSDKPGNSRIHVNRRVTNSGGYCVRCMEINWAVTDALEAAVV